MKKFVLILFISFNIFAQSKFTIDVDYARFRFDDSTGYLEIYYGFHQNELKPIKANGKLVVNGIINVLLKEKDSGKIIVNKSWQISNDVDSNSVADNQELNGILSFQLSFNTYNCSIKAKDGNNIAAIDSLSFDVKIEPIETQKFSISDIQLASTITKLVSKTNSFFNKNNFEVIPNPLLVYGEKLPVLYFYSEFYNIPKDLKSNFLKVNYTLFNYSEKNIYNKSKFISTANPFIVDVGAINILKYPSGVYKLTVELLDTVSNTSFFSDKKLYIYNPGVKDTTHLSSEYSKLLSTEFSYMEIDELERYFDFSRYIATNSELEEWGRLNLASSKQQFLSKFWQDKNKLFTQDGKNFQSEYLNRIDMANQRYSTFQKKGWKTDRGRVFIKYGEPGEIVRNPSQADTKPYETWNYYELEGGVIFVFAEMQGFGDYTLVHSTKRGELRDDNWQRKINTE